MPRPHRNEEMPTAYVVTGTDGVPPVQARMRDALAPIRPQLSNAFALFVGMWPLWAAVSLAMLLMWASAMGGSP